MQHILQHIDNNQLDAAFAALDRVAPQDYTYNKLKQEYISGFMDVDYLGRLKVYVQNLQPRTGKDGQPLRSQRILSPRTAAAPKTFLGRTKELADIATRLAQGTLMLVNGEGGIGKTTLAAKYWEENAQQYDYLAWLFCDKGIMNAIRNLAMPLGLDLSPYPREEDQLKILADTFRQLPGNCLLVLDNANDAKEVHKFEAFARDIPWQVLLTSRCTDQFDFEYRVNSLPPDKARELFLTYYAEDGAAFEELLDRFLKAVGYHTLCVEVFAKNLKRGNRWGYDFATFLEQLESKGLFLEDNSFEIRSEYNKNVQQAAADSDAILGILYDFSQLSEEETVLLIQLSLLPSEVFAPTLLEELFFGVKNDDSNSNWFAHLFKRIERGIKKLFRIATPLKKPKKKDFRKHINNLQRKGWLFSEDKGFRVSPVVQKIVLQRHEARKWEAGKGIVLMLKEKFRNGNLIDRPPLHVLGEYVELTAAVLDNLNDDNYNTCWLRIFLGDYYRDRSQSDLAIQQIEKTIDYFTDNSQRDLSVSFNRLGDILLQRNETKEAEEYFNKSLDIRQQLALDNPHSEQLQRDLSVSFNKLGEILLQRNENQKAEEYFIKSLEITQQLAQKNPQSETLQRDLGYYFAKLGDILLQREEIQKAEEYFLKSLEIDQQLAQNNPQSETLQRDLSVSFNKLGEILLQRNETQEAEEYFNQSLDIRQQLALDNPQSEQVQRDLSVSFDKLGDILLQRNETQKAEEYFLKSLEIFQQLALDNPQSEQVQRDLSVSFERLGDILLQRNENQKAEEYFLKSLEIFQQLALDNPQSEQVQRDLSVSFERLGDILLQRNENQKAEEYFLKSLEISRQLALDNPQSETLQRDLSLSFSKIGATAIAQNQLKKGLEYFQGFYDISSQLYDSNPKDVVNQSNFAEATAILAILHLQLESTENDPAQLTRAKSIWQELYEKNQSAYFQKKLDLLAQYEAGELDYREVVRLLSLE